MGMKLQRKVKIAWSRNFAYAIGLITSDGSLHRDKKHLWLSSIDEELVLNLKKALGLKNKIGKYARGGEKDKKYFYISFGDKVFYQFLNTIGLTQAKSKTIKKVEIPREYFSDFLRGVFDGDGTFYTFRDKRWPSSYGYQISFASASRHFIAWLKNKLTIYGVKGFVRRGDGVFNLRYVKSDSIKLFFVMYKKAANERLLFLRRKYDKIWETFLKDRLFNKLYPERYAAVAQR